MIRLKNGYKRRLLFVATFAMGLILLVSCAAMQQQQAYHRLVMKGSVIHTTDGGVYLCIGKHDGATVGQELDVYRIIFTGQPKTPAFKREKIGKVKITEIVDDHFASATIISGAAGIHDIVELAP